MGTTSVKGGMHIQVENRCLQSGSEVTGAINVMLQQSLPPCTLILQLKGIEKTHWEESRSRSVSDGEGGTTSETYTEHFDGKHIVINFKFPIYQWNSHIPEGCFTLPFCFRLPDVLPGSFSYQKGSTKASIEYKIKSRFILPDHKKLKDKAEINIYEKIQAFSTNILLEKNSRIKCFGCCDKGTCFIKSKFSQDAYTPDQVASAIIEADNTNGKVAIKNLACTLWRSIRLKTKSSTHFVKEKITESRARGVPVGEKLMDVNGIFLNLDLPSVRHLIDMNYSTRGSIIECMYSLDSHAILDGCCLCGGDTPSLEMPMVIYAMYAPSPRYVEPPPGWQPQVFEQVRFEYNQAYDVQTD